MEDGSRYSTPLARSAKKFYMDTHMDGKAANHLDMVGQVEHEKLLCMSWARESQKSSNLISPIDTLISSELWPELPSVVFESYCHFWL